KFVGNPFGDAASVLRIEPIVRVAERVNVAHGAAYRTAWLFEDLRELRGVKITDGCRLNLGIAALRDQRRQPSDLEIEADADEQRGQEPQFMTKKVHSRSP